ncbi:MAG TPA: hypothetical protein VH092_03335 [Urbifossiella sp.]|jgi:dipeptidyl aminopeptidase/acylaminoacyl peptidase|nr:hypothetical protein [Urbifossiella sp.]
MRGYHLLLAPVVVLLAALAGGSTPPAPPPPAPAPTVAGRAVDRPAREGQILVWQAAAATLYRPDGAVVRGWADAGLPPPVRVRLSPAGDTIAVVSAGPHALGAWGRVGRGTANPPAYHQLALYPVAPEPAAAKDVLPGKKVDSAAWAADGSRLYVTTDDGAAHHLVDPKTGAAAPFSLPRGHHVRDVSPDGKWVLTSAPGLRREDARRALLVPVGGGEPVAVNAPNEVASVARFSPDGRRVLVGGFRWRNHPDPEGPPGAVVPVNEGWLATMTVAAPGRWADLPIGERETAVDGAWSPDGARIVTARQEFADLDLPVQKRTVVVTDAAGRNARVIARVDGGSMDPVAIDWR